MSRSYIIIQGQCHLRVHYPPNRIHVQWFIVSIEEQIALSPKISSTCTVKINSNMSHLYSWSESSVSWSACSSTSPLPPSSSFLNGLQHSSLQAHAQYTVHDIFPCRQLQLSVPHLFPSALQPHLTTSMRSWRLVRYGRYWDPIFDLPPKVCHVKFRWSLLVS